MSKGALSFFCFMFAFLLASGSSVAWPWFLLIGVILL